jgi:hypothetical protein
LKTEITQKLKLLSKADFLTIFLFTAGFLFAVTDMKLLNLMTLCVKLLSQGTFIVLYLVFIGVMFGMIKIIMKNLNLFRISKEVLLEKKVWIITSSVFRIICVGYTIGFVVNLLNAFVIETFAKIAV